MLAPAAAPPGRPRVFPQAEKTNPGGSNRAVALRPLAVQRCGSPRCTRGSQPEPRGRGQTSGPRPEADRSEWVVLVAPVTPLLAPELHPRWASPISRTWTCWRAEAPRAHKVKDVGENSVPVSPVNTHNTHHTQYTDSTLRVRPSHGVRDAQGRRTWRSGVSISIIHGRTSHVPGLRHRLPHDRPSSLKKVSSSPALATHPDSSP